MEKPSELLQQLVFNARLKDENHMLIFMDEPADEENLFQHLRTDVEQIKTAVTFLTAYNGIFKVTTKNFKFFSAKSKNQDGFQQITIPPAAYENESLYQKNEGKKYWRWSLYDGGLSIFGQTIFFNSRYYDRKFRSQTIN